MASLTSTAVRRPVATMMFFLVTIVVGVVSLRSLPVDLLPRVEFTQLTVRVRYPNVGPQEIEQLITDPIENVVSGLPNLSRMTSESEEGSSEVRLEFARGTNIDEAANDLRAALDRLRDELPVEADPPEIYKLDLDRSDIVSLAATSTHDLERLTRILEDEISTRLEKIPGVGTLEVRGGIYREIRVELMRDRLAAAGLTALDVEQAIGRENLTVAGGNVRSGFADLHVRVQGEYQSLDEIRATVIATRSGLPLRVRDVAAVSDDYEDARYLVEVNGVPAVTLRVQKQSGANTVAVAAAVREEVGRLNAERDDVHLTVVTDQSRFIRQSIANVRSSALWGSLLAVLVLYLFLRRAASTAIIALSIPISVISAFGLLYFGGLTLNQMTFGGLALGVGMVIDNAIVVLESIVRKREETAAGAEEASLAGTREVAGAIVASTLTTSVIFLPVVFTRTTSGALFQALAMVIVFALLCSLLVALTLVPMLAARLLRSPRGARPAAAGGSSLRRLENWYAGRLRLAIKRRGVVFAATGGLLLVSILMLRAVPVELAPATDADEIDIDLEMAQGTNIAVVRAYVDELELRVQKALPAGAAEIVATEVRGSNAGVELALAPAGERPLGSSELADLLRERIDGEVPGGELRVRAHSGLWVLRRIFSAGGREEALQIELRGYDLERADALAAEILSRLTRIHGITDVQVSRREGQPEDRLIFDRERIAELGLAVEEVARTIQANVGGAEAGYLRERGEEYPIVVRLRPEDRLTPHDLRGISLRTSGGQVVPLLSVVETRRGRGPLAIERVDGQRVTYVTGSLETGVALGDAVEQVRGALADLAMPSDFSLSFGGEYEEQQRARRDFTIAIVMALLLVYMLMAGQFERFLDPLIVMLAVPMALVGVAPILLATGTTLNLQSVMGLVMLVGIVVNNAIILVDTINLLRREQHLGAVDAVAEAGRLRLRPILMTTSTTVLGLSPLALGWGAGGEIQASLARVVIGGLVASTLVTLILIPVAYTSATGWLARSKASRWFFDRGEQDEDRAATA
jgi:HAE1 family hydrophobic/amphiphilic exporter-1